jgi:hypothetical protein
VKSPGVNTFTAKSPELLLLHKQVGTCVRESSVAPGAS